MNAIVNAMSMNPMNALSIERQETHVCKAQSNAKHTDEVTLMKQRTLVCCCCVSSSFRDEDPRSDIS